MIELIIVYQSCLVITLEVLACQLNT